MTPQTRPTVGPVEAIAMTRFVLADDLDSARAILASMETVEDLSRLLVFMAELVKGVAAEQPVPPEALDRWLGNMLSQLALDDCGPPDGE